jgi:hypothetical protein
MCLASTMRILGLAAGGLWDRAGPASFARDDRRYNHAIRHLFALTGGIRHDRAMPDRLANLPA